MIFEWQTCFHSTSQMLGIADVWERETIHRFAKNFQWNKTLFWLIDFLFFFFGKLDYYYPSKLVFFSPKMRSYQCTFLLNGFIHQSNFFASYIRFSCWFQNFHSAVKPNSWNKYTYIYRICTCSHHAILIQHEVNTCAHIFYWNNKTINFMMKTKS